MSGIAQLFLCRGAKVSGSDLKQSKITDALQAAGAKIFIGHNAENTNGAGLVVYSSAIKDDNPEIQQARKKNIPLIKRAQALAELMQDKTVITVTGSHGKTTTTSLVSCLLMEAGLNPTVAIGGILRNIEKNACFGNGKYFVAEADESDGSFLYYQPKYSIITNIDHEHLDYYKDFKNVINTFREFLNKTDNSGCVFCSSDDVNLGRILKEYKNKFILFGLNNKAQIYPKNIVMHELSSQFDCFYGDKFVSSFSLPLGGLHNISNALSVIALGTELGIDTRFIKSALGNYKGAGRRIEIKFKNNDYLIIDDYAHHPTEIKATLSALRNIKSNRLIAVFQPHRYTRTKLLFKEFTRAFDLADRVVITDIYPASEPPLEGITGESLARQIKINSGGKKVDFVPKEKISEYILNEIEPADLVVTLGAGDISKVNDELVEKIKRRNQA